MSKLIMTLSFASLLALAGTALAVGEKPSFDELDANKDGMLTKSEAAKAPGLDFAKADRNKDGHVDRTEYQAATS